MPTHVKTGKIAGRRDLTFGSLDEVLADLDRLEQADRAGALRALGNWSPGQVFDHLAILFEKSIDGFDFTSPLPVRMVALLFKKRVIRGGRIPAGHSLRGAALALLPREDVSFDAGASRLRAAISRVKEGARMTQPSPAFGAMRHEDWMTLHLKHCELHLSFLIPA